MIPEVPSRACQCCGKTIKGRSDKKYCDDYCRNNFNNQLKSGDNHYVRNINNALRKNRRILQEALGQKEDMVRVSREKLLLAGFHFRYNTHHHVNKKGNRYFFCYEYGYRPLEKEAFLVIRKTGNLF